MLDILFYSLIGITVIQLLYYVVIFGKFSFAKVQKSNPKRIPVSVIVCAKNEGENVRKFIPLLAEQNYPDFEIVLIDDSSSDNTFSTVRRWIQQSPKS